jgi:hypothetical protein
MSCRKACYNTVIIVIAANATNWNTFSCKSRSPPFGKEILEKKFFPLNNFIQKHISTLNFLLSSGCPEMK